MNVEGIAIVAHEAHRAFCAGNGDTSIASWDETDVAIRTDAMAGVQFIIDGPDATPQICHEHWLADKQQAGWTWGEVKDPANRKHPCCVPWDDLPTLQRTKELLFLCVVHALIAQ